MPYDEKPPHGLTPSEKLAWYKNKKKERNRQAVKKHRDKQPKHKQKTPCNKKYIHQIERNKQFETENERKRQINRERAKRFRAKQSLTSSETSSTFHFANRMQKCRAVKQVKDTIRAYTPEKRCEIIKALLSSKSPKSVETRRRLEFNNVVRSETESLRDKVADAVLTDAETSLKILKNDSSTKATTKTVTSCLVGSKIEQGKLQTAFATHTSLNRRLISKSLKLNKRIVDGENIKNFTSRKTRRDKLSEEVRETVTQFWIKNSQPVNDKRKVVRERVGPKTYIENPKHILTSTQRNIYLNFVKENPELKIGQRLFESLKPYFIKNASKKDRLTCLCKQHVEASSLFKNAKDLRKSILEKMPELKTEYKIWDSLTDILEESLCEPVIVNGQELFKISCLRRTCSDCGVGKIKLMSQELDETDNSVSWQKYENLITGRKDKKGKDIKKQTFIKVKTSPYEMWTYIKESLSSFPLHKFLSFWQKQQLESLTENLTRDHVVMIHDYSEDFKCELQDEIQSDYFSRNEVSMHVTVLYRHDTSIAESTDAEKTVVKEYAFVIFESNTHDRDTIHHVRKLLIQKYLREELNYNVQFVHEFTDGCSQQYKSRFCMFDVSNSDTDFNCTTQRNYFETSHGKGEQDAAGSHVKNKAHMSVIRRECEIHSAKDLYLYLNSSFRFPTSSLRKSKNGDTKLKRRLFFFVEDSEIEVDRHCFKIKNVKENRQLHSIRSIDRKPGFLLVRKIACYCKMCLSQKYEDCLYSSLIGPWEERQLTNDN